MRKERKVWMAGDPRLPRHLLPPKTLQRTNVGLHLGSPGYLLITTKYKKVLDNFYQPWYNALTTYELDE